MSMNFSNHFLPKSRLVAPGISGLLLALGLMAVASGPALAQTTPPPAECNEFAESVNRNQVIMASFEAEIATFAENAAAASTLDEITAAASQYVSAVDAVTDSLDELANELASLAFTDAQLQGYRDGYVDVLAGFNQALDTVNMAMSQVAIAETEADLIASLETVEVDSSTAIDQIAVLATDESTLIDDVNGYCGVE
jgi:ABC-type transporter Mla subunit MlaD